MAERRVLLTGAKGFLGTRMLPQLDALGFDVHAVSRSPAIASGPRLHWHSCNLHDHTAMRSLVADIRPTYLLHSAWCTTPGAYWTSIENVEWVETSLALLRAFATHGGLRALIIGTCAEYDWRIGGTCNETDTPCTPHTLYGVSKNALREIAESFSKTVGLSFAWARLFFPYGPGESSARLIPSVVRAILEGTPPQCTHGRQIRDFIHVDDAAAAAVELLASDVTGAVNIGTGQPASIRELVSMIADKLDHRGEIEWGAVEAAADEPPVLIADTGRLRDEVHWRQQHSLRSGVEDAVDWWIAQMPRV